MQIPFRLGPSVAALALGICYASGVLAGDCPAFLDHDFARLRSSEKVNLCKAYAGKPLLIVNTASHCGYTPQFKALEAVHEKYAPRGLVVVVVSELFFNAYFY